MFHEHSSMMFWNNYGMVRSVSRYRVPMFFIRWCVNFYPLPGFDTRSRSINCRFLSPAIVINGRSDVPTWHDVGNCEEDVGSFMSVVTKVLSCKWRVYVGCSSEEVYVGRLEGVCVWVCAGLSLYVFLYEGVDLYYEYETGFL